MVNLAQTATAGFRILHPMLTPDPPQTPASPPEQLPLPIEPAVYRPGLESWPFPGPITDLPPLPKPPSA